MAIPYNISKQVYDVFMQSHVGVNEITEQVIARRQLEQNVLMIKNLFMNAPAWICTFTGAEHVFDLVNPAYQKLFGKRELLGKRLIDAIPEIKGQGFIEILDNVYKTGEIFIAYEILAVMAPDENTQAQSQFFNLSYQPIYDHNQQITGILAFGYEVTEQVNARNKTEQHLKQILETIPEIAWAASPENPVSFYNKRFYDYTGMSAEQAQKDWKWESIVHPDMFEERNRAWENCLKNGCDFYFETLLKRGSDQSYRWHISRATAIRKENGEIDLWVGTSSDIHEQKLFAKELERQVQIRTKALEESNLNLRHSNDNLQQFASIASHDLQEPLRKIQTFTLLLEQRFKSSIPEEAGKIISKINNSSQRMSVLIRDVLNFSRITREQIPFAETDLNKIIENVVVDFEILIQAKKVELNVSDLPLIEAIESQINQLFHNLFENALKFSRDSVIPSITITGRKMDMADVNKFSELDPSLSFVEIIFTDNGIGFDQQFAEDIFLIFHRLNNQEQYAGTGIGLALCRTILEHHHGKIFAEGVEGGGSEFHIIIPVKQPV